MRKRGLLLTTLLTLLLVIAIGVSAAVAHGDYTADGKVGSQDALYLLRHALNPGKYPIDQSGDVNGDGKSNSQDAVYLLRHSLDPENYPISQEHTVQTLPGKPATCCTDGLTEGQYCSVCDHVLQEQTVIAATGHEYVNDVCVKCGMPVPSEGLNFTLNGSSYVLTGLGDCTDSHIVVPDTHEGLPVSGVAEMAITGQGVTKVTLGANIRTIHSAAFYQCESLTEIYILQEEAEFAGNNVINGCAALQTVYFAGDPVYWEAHGFTLDEAVSLVTDYGHVYTASVTVKPTCTQNGQVRYTCSDCGRTYTRTTEPAGHSYTDPQQVEPTCITEGSVTGYCSVCDLDVTENLPKLDHDIASYSTQKAATCTENGVESGLCGMCGQVCERTIPALGHIAGVFVQLDGTCGERQLGYTLCVTCDEKVYEVAHQLKTTNQPAGCTTAGYLLEECLNCDYENRQTVEAIGHSTGQWKKGTAATCTAAGTEVRVCLTCNTVLETRSTQQLDHQYESAVQEQTCTYTCRSCGHSYTEQIENKIRVSLVAEGLDLADIYVEAGQAAQLPTIAKENAVFEGWYYDAGFSVPYENEAINQETTFYGLFSAETVTVTYGNAGTQTNASTDYEFAVVAPGGLSDSTLSSYVTVTDTEMQPVNIYISRTAGQVYYIRGDYKPGQIYEAKATGGATLVISGTEPHWFVVNGPERTNTSLKANVHVISQSDISGRYEQNGRLYLVSHKDILDVGQLAMVCGETETDYLVAAEVVAESQENGFYHYEYIIPDATKVFAEYDVFTRGSIDMSNVIPAEDVEAQMIAEVEESQLYADFMAASQEYVRLKSYADMKYYYELAGTKIKVSVKPVNEEGTTYVAISLKITNKIQRLDTATREVNDVFTLTMSLDSKVTADASVHIPLFRGYSRAACQIKTDNTVTFTFGNNPDDHSGEEMTFFKNLLKTIQGNSDLRKVESTPLEHSKDVLLCYVPVYLPCGVSFDLGIYGVFQAELTGQIGVQVHSTSTTNIKIQLINWFPLVSSDKQSTVTMDAYLAGKVRFSAGIKVDLGMNIVEFFRLGGDITFSAYAEVGGVIRFLWEVGQQAKFMADGYLELGLNFEGNLYAEIGRGAFGRYEYNLFDIDVPLLQVGTKKIPIYFETRDEHYDQDITFGSKYSLEKLIDRKMRYQDFSDMTFVSESVTGCSYALVGEAHPAITLSSEGILSVKVSDFEEEQITVRVSKGSIYKDVTVNLKGHAHELTKSQHTGGCEEDLVYRYKCDHCKYYYDEWVSAAPGHAYGEWTGTDATCQGWGTKTRSCANCDHQESKRIKPLGHKYTIQNPTEQYLITKATCVALAEYQYACANCAKGSLVDTYTHGGYAPHIYADEFTCHDRPCQQKGCTHVEGTTTEHRFTSWYEVPEGGCNVTGYSVRACSDCGYCETNLSDTVIHGHDWAVSYAQAPTCTEPGYADHVVCQKCGIEANKTAVPALGHNILYKDITENAHVAYCHRTGCDYVSDAQQHTLEQWITDSEPDCVNDGSAHSICVCGYRATKVLPALGHTLKTFEEKKPTCTQTGYKAYEKCANCDYTTFEELPALGHLYDGSSYGSSSRGHWEVCARANCSVAMTTVPTAHSYGAWNETKAPTCTDKGTQERSCTVCGYEETEQINALGHDYTDVAWTAQGSGHVQICNRCKKPSEVQEHVPGVWTTQTAPACEESGVDVTTCTVCSADMSRTVEPLKHVEGSTWEYNKDEHFKRCAREGCEHITSRASHDYGSQVTEVPADCENTGTWRKTCQTCQYIQRGQIEALGHSYGAWQHDGQDHWRDCTRSGCDSREQEPHTLKKKAVVAATCETDGYTTYSCACGYEEDKDVVQALGHDYTDWSYDETTHSSTCTRCGENVDRESHDFSVWREIKAPTCLAKGTDQRQCNDCGYTEQRDVAAMGHDDSGELTYSDAEHYKLCVRCGEKLDKQDHDLKVVKTVESTCTTYGYTDYSCICGYEKRVDATTLKDHDEQLIDQKAPTCTEDGYKVFRCTECSTERTETVEATGHDPQKAETVASTCIESGYTVYSCACGYSEHRDPTEPLGHLDTGTYSMTDEGHAMVCGRPGCTTIFPVETHKYGQYQVIQAPTCLDKGLKQRTCTVCTYAQSAEIDPIGHDSTGKLIPREDHHYRICPDCDQEIDHAPHEPVFAETVKPTCEKDGYSIYRCACGYEEQRDATLANGHDYVEHDGQEATCTEPGWQAYLTCRNCDLNTKVDIPAKGHQMSDDLRYDETYHFYVCVDCGEPEDNKTKHTMDEEVVTPATCTDGGSKRVYCLICPYEYNDVVEKNPDHDHTAQWTYDQLQHYRICAECEEKIDIAEHTYTEKVTEPTCTEDGYTTRTCSCGYSYTLKPVAAYGHDYETSWSVDQTTGEHYYKCLNGCGVDKDRQTHTYGAWETSIEPTCTSEGVAIKKCTACQHQFEQTQAVDKLPHDLYEGATTTTKVQDGETLYIHTVSIMCHNCDYCDPSDETYVHVHDTVKVLYAVAATCTEPGLTTGIVCGATGCTDVLLAQEETPALGHDYVDGYCTRCGDQEAGELNYQISTDGTYYIVTGIGTYTQTDVVIPATHLDLPVREIGAKAFMNNTTITSVVISDTVTTIGDYAFYYCTGMTSLTIGNGVKTIGKYAFSSCTHLTTLVIPDSVTQIGDSAFVGALRVTTLIIGNGVTSIGSDAFGNLCYLTSVTMGNSVSVIGAYAFSGCSALTTITLPESLTTIEGYAFNDCTGLTEITIPANVSGIYTSIFKGCTGLEGIWVDSNNAKYSNDSYGVLYNKDKTTLIAAPGAISGEYVIPSGVTYISGNAFYSCRELTAVVIPDTVTGINDGAFQYCTGLTTVTIPDSVTFMSYSVFDGCTGLTSVTISNSVTILKDGMFYGCTGLTSVTIPDGVTCIGYATFHGCTGLNSVTIPASVTGIDDYAFKNCTGLKTVYFDGTSEQWAAVTKGTDWDYGCSFEVICLGDPVEGSQGLEYFRYGGVPDYYTVSGIGTCTDTDIVIPAVYDGLPVAQIDYGAFENNTTITSVVIPESVTYIGTSAFANCSELQSVTIQGGVELMDYYAFENCAKLTTVTIDDGVTHIGYGAFKDCVSLSTVVLPDSITRIDEHAFFRCTSLTSINIPRNLDFITRSTFSDCTNLTSVTIPYGVSGIGSWAFGDCTGIKTITIPASVTSIGSLILANGDLETVYYTGTQQQWDAIQKAESWAGAYGYELICLGTEEVPESDAGSVGLAYRLNDDQSSYSLIGRGNCEDAHVVVPATHQGKPVTGIDENSFEWDSTLVSITIPESVTRIDRDAFWYTESLEGIWVAEGNQHYSSDDRGVLFNLDKSVLIKAPQKLSGSYEIPDTVTEISEYAFSGCVDLTSVEFPAKLTDLGYYAFSNAGLTSVELTGEDLYIEFCAFLSNQNLKTVTLGEGVIGISDHAFSGCSALETVTISESMEYLHSNAFYECTSLKTIYYTGIIQQWNIIYKDEEWDATLSYELVCLGEPWDTSTSWGLEYALSEDETYYIVSHVGYCTDTDVVIPATYEGLPVKAIGNEAFQYCQGLTTVTIPDGVFSIGPAAFAGCDGLTSVNIPDSVTMIGASAFSGCAGLTSVVIPDSVTYLGNYAFSWCTGLTSVTISNNVESIGESTFAYCSGLTSVTIPDKVTSIEYWAFAHCTSLTSIVIPDSVTEVGYGAFRDCTALATVTLSDSMTYISSELFVGCTGLTSVDIPEGVTEIGANAFQGCTGLTSVILPEGLYYIQSYGFADCTGLVTITVPESVYYIAEYVFAGCTGLETFYYGGSQDRWEYGVEKGEGWNQDCFFDLIFMKVSDESDEPTYPEYPTASEGLKFVSVDGGTAYNVSGLGTCADTDVVIPMYYEDKPVTGIYKQAFYNKTKITSVTIPETVTTIGDSAFQNCSKLTDVYAWGNITSIGQYAFYKCTSLNQVQLGYGLETLKYAAFANCSSLTEIYLPDSLTTIGGCAFMSCTSLETIYYGGTTEQWNAISKTSNWDSGSDYELVCYGDMQPTYTWVLALIREEAENTIFHYATGQLDDGGMVTSEDEALATEVFLEESEEYAAIYVEVEGEKRYINMVMQDGVVGIQLGETLETSYYYNEEVDAIVATVDGVEYGFGAKAGETTVRPIATTEEADWCSVITFTQNAVTASTDDAAVLPVTDVALLVKKEKE